MVFSIALTCSGDESSHQWKSCQSSHASHAARVNCQTRRVWRSSRCHEHAPKVRSRCCGQRDALVTQPLGPCSVPMTNLSIFSLVIWCDQQSCVSVWLMRPLPASERCPRRRPCYFRAEASERAVSAHPFAASLFLGKNSVRPYNGNCHVGVCFKNRYFSV